MFPCPALSLGCRSTRHIEDGAANRDQANGRGTAPIPPACRQLEWTLMMGCTPLPPPHGCSRYRHHQGPLCRHRTPRQAGRRLDNRLQRPFKKRWIRSRPMPNWCKRTPSPKCPKRKLLFQSLVRNLYVLSQCFCRKARKSCLGFIFKTWYVSVTHPTAS